MSDVFISYSREDRPTAESLAGLLEGRGWSVWWDRDIVAGQDFDEAIEKAVQAARCVVVLWSDASVHSGWVRAEAEEGARRDALVPILLEEVDIPLRFRQIQAEDFSGWDGSATHPACQKLLRDVSWTLDPSLREEPGGAVPGEPDAGSSRRRWKPAVAATGFLALGAFGLWLWAPWGEGRIPGADKEPATEAAPADSRTSSSPEAMRHYRRARYFMNQWTEEGLRKGIEQFEQAVASDPGFAMAYVGMAEAHTILGDVVAVSGDIRPVDFMPRARELVLKALEIDPALAEAHRMLGFIRWYYDYDYVAGEKEARLATELDPMSADAWAAFGLALSVVGRNLEAIEAFERAIALEPVSAGIHSDYSAALYVARRYKEALDMATMAIELDPDRSTAYANAAFSLLFLGRHDEAIEWYKRAREISDHPWYLGMQGFALGWSGREQEALRILEALTELRKERYVSPRALANAYLGVGDVDAAIEWLVRGAEMRDPGLNLFEIRGEHTDVLREHPRYPELLTLVRMERQP